jgi:uncharacterized protein (TIGR01777 family)
MEKVLITGGTGLVGKHLIKHLKRNGYEVRVLSRNKKKTGSNLSYFYWDPAGEEIDMEAFRDVDHLIHLAGAGILDRRWTAKRKRVLIESRVATGRFLYKMIRNNKVHLKSFVTASGIGYYGAVTSEKVFIESDVPHDDFVAEVCKQWERSADSFSDFGVRTVKLRIGVVLSCEGGALPSLMRPIKLGLGAPIGSGRQYIPWIHINDLCRIFIRSLKDNQMEGAFNSVAPEHQTNRSMTRAISKAVGKPLWLPNIPAGIIKMLMGERSCLILKGSKVSNRKIENTGFEFEFKTLEMALKNLID